MGKVRRLSRAFVRREFVIAAGGTFVAVIGLASSVLGISGRHFELRDALVVLCLGMAVSCAIHYRKLVSPQVAVDDVLAPDWFDDPSARLHCPCDAVLATQAKRLAQACFTGSVSIEPEVFEQFRVKNPRVLACLTGRTGAFLGYFDAIPLADAFAESLLRGTTTEAQITHEDVLSPDEARRCKYVFVSGFAVVAPDSVVGKRSANMLTWALLKYLDAFYGSAKPLVFALAATRSGDEILQRFRLEPGSQGAERRDKYRLYKIKLTREAIQRRLVCLPDWRFICRLDFAPEGPRGDSALRPTPPRMHPWELAPGNVPP